MKSAKKIQESARKGIIQPFTLDLYPITPSGTVSVSKTLEEISDYSIEHPRHVAERDDCYDMCDGKSKTVEQKSDKGKWIWTEKCQGAFGKLKYRIYLCSTKF